jgi:membrane-associated phospholipid phosphatase
MSKIKARTDAPYTSFNPYFLVPYFIWLVVGGLALVLSDRRTLFSMFNMHHSSWGDELMANVTLLGEGIFSAVILLVMLGVSQYRNWWYFSCAILTNGVSALLIQAVKFAIDSPRPLKYFNEAVWIHVSDDWPRLMNRSFPSGHTCAAFCLFTFLAILLPPKHRWWGIVFFLLALFVGYSRIYLAAHFFEDVYAGSILGGIFTMAVMYVMNKKADKFFIAENSVVDN